MNRNGLLIIAGVVGVALFAAVGALLELWTDFLWFGTVGYESVFITVIASRIKLGILVGFVFLLVLLANSLVADRLSKVGFIKVADDAIELPGIEALGANTRVVIFGASIFFAFILGLEASSRWASYLSFLNAAEFGTVDPVFGRDISFYVFKLPFIEQVYQWCQTCVAFSLITSFSVYLSKRGIVITESGVHYKSTFLSHMSVLAGAFLLLKAVSYRLAAYKLLLTANGFISGAGYTDVHVRLPILNALFFACVIVAVVFFANVFLKSWKVPAAAAGALVVFMALGSGAPELFQRLRVTPNEISMEKPFIENQINYTRVAYGLDKIVAKPFTSERKLTAADLDKNNATIENIRLWDTRPLLQTYQQLQEIRTYYSFASVDIDRYYIDGEYRQVMLSPRELSYAKLPSRIWINERLSFTHGYGVVLTPVNRVTPEGMPEFFIKDIPPVHSTDVKVEQPRIYYGELSNDYAFTKTQADEFDYPQGNKNVFIDYDGAGGVPLDSILKKAAFALRFQSLPTLLNTDIDENSRVMIYRNVSGSGASPSRAGKIMPLLAYDSDPYIVVVDGRMKWIIDAYSLSKMFPYSQRYSSSADSKTSFNYIRNSVKTVIDAYDGSVDFYVYDPDDPIVKTYSAIFPGLFKSREDMPQSLREHVRYPVDMFRVQSHVYSTYHMEEPQVFYNKEDQWTNPREIFYQAESEMEPYYVIMRLPEEEKEEFVLMMPFTPSGRDNLSAWMCARSDGQHYGELLVYKFPKKKLVFGPFQVEARIDQDPEISKQFTLWSQKGSQIIRGNMLVIPIEDALLYVEPVFLKAEKGEIPELKRVIVSTGSRVVMEPTLEAALERLIVEYSATLETAEEREASGESPAEGATDSAALIRKSLEHLRKAKESMKNLDWRGFGKQFENLEKTLERADSQSEEKPAGDAAE